jgi:hypothetical protein
MIHQFWRLSEAGEKNLGLACTGDGLLLGRTPLVERRDVRFVVREPGEVDRLLTRAYQNAPPLNRLMPGFAAVAAALNANDLCLAHIVAVHLRIPDLPSQVARDAMEAEDVLIKSAARNRPFHVQTDKSIHKASPDDAKHPGWPAGTPGGLGGKFRPKDDAESAITQQIENKIERIMMRRAIRTAALAVLRLTGEGAANFIPFLGLVTDAAMAVDVARTIAEFRDLAIDAAAAVDFVKKGPYSLKDLQVPSNGYEEFSSYREFIKGELSLDEMAKRFGGAGDGNQYHHVVTQGGANDKNIPQNLLQNTDNIVCLPTLLHEAVNAEYSQAERGKNMTKYQWLQTQPYDVQREEGLKILRKLHILN